MVNVADYIKPCLHKALHKLGYSDEDLQTLEIVFNRPGVQEYKVNGDIVLIQSFLPRGYCKPNGDFVAEMD